MVSVDLSVTANLRAAPSHPTAPAIYAEVRAKEAANRAQKTSGVRRQPLDKVPNSAPMAQNGISEKTGTVVAE
ncbi:hypothetical protein TRAPUB_3230, partial [Trametes pubescens]